MFKIIPLKASATSVEERRRTATVIGPLQERRIRVQISKHEFVGSLQEIGCGETRVVVYTPALIAAEKLRAICQQMPDYPHNRNHTPRARDFYDIHAICTEASIDLTTQPNRDLVSASFRAKEVPIRLLRQIQEHADFHRSNWPEVELSVGAPLGDFDFYCQFVSALARRLESLLE